MNQYTQRTVPDQFAVYGTASTGATIMINGTTVPPGDRQGAYYSAVEATNNTASAAYPQVVVEASEGDIVATSTGRVFVAKTPEVFSYDADGNLTQDGRFTNEWNAENRLIGVTTLTGLPAEVPEVSLAMEYDHQGRRIAQFRSVWNGQTFTLDETRCFIYDGWNLVGETRTADSVTVTNWYVWGLDLSGTIQGAGGVGGLLFTSFGATNSPSSAYCSFDGNGNVSELVGTNGAILAHYEYDPFGNLTTEAGALAAKNPFRFSAKYWDADAKLAYYGYRYYSPGMGRWASRDPIGESQLNLFLFSNKNMSSLDMLGLVELDLFPLYGPVKDRNIPGRGRLEHNSSLNCDCYLDQKTYFWQLSCTLSARPVLRINPEYPEEDQVEAKAHEERHWRVYKALYVPQFKKCTEPHEKNRYCDLEACLKKKVLVQAFFMIDNSRLIHWERWKEYYPPFPPGKTSNQPGIDYGWSPSEYNIPCSYTKEEYKCPNPNCNCPGK